jgi:hypothetical protein
MASLLCLRPLVVEVLCFWVVHPYVRNPSSVQQVDQLIGNVPIQDGRLQRHLHQYIYIFGYI